MNRKENLSSSCRFYYNVSREAIIIGFKSLKEYKANVFASLIHHLFFMITLPFAYIFLEKFGDTIGWNFVDFILLSLFATNLVVVLGTFYWGNQLRYYISKGKLNLGLIRPVNVFFHNYFARINYIMPIFIIYSLLTYLPFLFYFNNFNFINFILCYALSVFLGFLFLPVAFFLDSFNFYFLNINKEIDFALYDIREMLEIFPGSFFVNSKIKYLLFLVPTYFVATLLVPIYKGVIPSFFWFEVGVIFVIFVVCSLGTFINWKYGLKRYEGFS